ncbi:MAG: hypothetical protein EA426_05075 [Spirochaetaceae bacterium]|nr:MAG: hypothetical protein EA426_05075 [Spirochaetaceae bacterium]
MAIAQYLTPERVIFIPPQKGGPNGAELTEKECMLRELAATFPARVGSVESIVAAIDERERQVSTSIAPGIALPHANIDSLDEAYIAVGLSEQGLRWDAKDTEVQLVVMLLSNTDVHLQVLSEVARVLSISGLYDRAVTARSPSELYGILTDPSNRAGVDEDSENTRISQATVRNGLNLADDLGASAIVVYPDALGSMSFITSDLSSRNVLLVSREPERYDAQRYGIKTTVEVPFRGVNRSNLVQLSFLYILSHRFLSKGDTAISIFGDADTGRLDTVVYTDLSREFAVFFTLREETQTGDLEESVFTRTIQIAVELAQEGREGKPAGTLFVLGDYPVVSRHVQQLVVNPFRGYPESERNILDPSLEETVKEFSRIDGAFVIRGDGVIESCGTYIRTDDPVDGLPSGLGARHTAAAAISAATDATAVAISESTKRISLFKNGRLVMTL